MAKFAVVINKKIMNLDGKDVRETHVYAHGPIAAYNRAKKLCSPDERVSYMENGNKMYIHHVGKLLSLRLDQCVPNWEVIK